MSANGLAWRIGGLELRRAIEGRRDYFFETTLGGKYNAAAELLPLAVLLGDPGRKKEKTAPGETGRRRYMPIGCGGAILPLANSVVVERGVSEFIREAET